MDESFLKQLFPNYLRKLTNVIYQPHRTFFEIFNNEPKPFFTAIMFSIMSIFISLTIFILPIKLDLIPLRPNLSIDADSLFKYSFLLIMQILVTIPVSGGYLHVFCKLFKGSGDIFTSIIIYLYSYALTPYVSILYIISLFVESFFGQPVLFELSCNPTLRTIELVIEIIFILFVLYILSRGIQAGHKMKYRTACLVTILLSVLPIVIGRFGKSLYIKYVH